jgi:hypothetical protein
VRSVFVQWPVLVGRGPGLFEDLRRHTPLDTIELSDFTLDWDATQLDSGPEQPGQLALPATDAFGDLPVPVASAAEYERLHAAIQLAASEGFTIACNVTPFYLSDPATAGLGCVDVDGRQVPGLRRGLGVYGCPANPEVMAYGEAMARAFVASWPDLDVLMINHAEYPLWPQSRVEEVLTCFCEGCRTRAASQGLDLERVAEDLRAFGTRLRDAAGTRSEFDDVVREWPDLARWLAFRRDAISEGVERIVAGARDEAQARGRRLVIGLEAQLPALAPLVGTDLDRLARATDLVVAKFPDYLPGAVLPWIAGRLAVDGGDRLFAGLRESLGLGPGPERYEPARNPGEGIRYGNAFDPDVFDLQLARLAAAREQGPVYAYLWKYGDDDADLGNKLRAAEERGFDGYFLWVWNRDLAASALRTWPPTTPTTPTASPRS